MTGAEPLELSTHHRVDRVTAQEAPVQALGALFDDTHDARAPLPPLWHWAALASWPDVSTTGHDGHPRVGGLIPDVGKPRRMFIGGTVELLGDLHVGAEVRRETQVVSAEPKQGRLGEFVLVRVQTTLKDAATGTLAVREQQHLAYRDPGPKPGTEAAVPSTPAVPSAPAAALLERAEDGWLFATDPTKLMRFSSATANGHRIHYDYPYATGVEGYPGLVVHGPLMTLALAQVLRREGDVGQRGVFTHRSVRPLFCGQQARITTGPSSDGGLEARLHTTQGTHSLLTVTAT